MKRHSCLDHVLSKNRSHEDDIPKRSSSPSQTRCRRRQTWHTQATIFILVWGFLELHSLCHEMLSSRSPVVDPWSFIDIIVFSNYQYDCCHSAGQLCSGFTLIFLSFEVAIEDWRCFKLVNNPKCSVAFKSMSATLVSTKYEIHLAFPMNITKLFLIYFSLCFTP